MKIYSSGIIEGTLQDKYGKRGREKKFSMPTLSFPFTIIDPPREAKSFAVVFDDPDSIKVCGKIWIHWLIANLHKTEVEEGASQNSFDFIQGKNTWNENCYGGPCPPDAPHSYRLTVYALKDDLPLRGNFTKEQLDKCMKGKILDTTHIYATYSN